MKEENQYADKMHLKFVHKSTSLIITLNTIIINKKIINSLFALIETFR